MEKPPVPIEIIVQHPDNVCRTSESDSEEFQDACEGMLEDASCKPVLPWCDETELRSRLMMENDKKELEIHYEQKILYDQDEVDDLEVEDYFCFPSFDTAKENAEMFVKRVWEASWTVTHFHSLPDWLRDNDFLKSGHRPPLPSFNACFKSIFRLHTETGNIWTHMLGCATFIGVAAYFLSRPETEVQWQEKLVFSVFFLSAITCLGFSSAFHTVSCHSERVVKIFSKLDYCGISLLIVGSFVPWLFYGFYCRRGVKIFYTVFIVILGAGCVIVSLIDRFSSPQHRPTRTIMFVSLGLCGIIPCVHYFVTEGVYSAFNEASFGWLMLMAVLYISGAILYALRVPERFFPGKCDIWCQSHQLFHLFVVAAAFVHYHGISELAIYRLSAGPCEEESAVTGNRPPFF
ncbi:ADIPOR-like receptor [Trichinella papuae]|uniref:ADIPOR-like receptor n=1 Tax=Trichinella papuae TaxID=268474 RepID=A0A0V1M958_9BILA|nr:ADIPOR-like receptor [Trichinella papuae]